MSGINLGEGEEMMRNLLRSADRTREATTPMQNRPAPDQELRDLASLIGSLDIDLTKTVTKERPKHVAADTRSETESQFSAPSSIHHRFKSDASFDDDSFQSSQLDFVPLTQNNSSADKEDYTVVRYGTRYVLRGKLGKYLTAVPEEVGTTAQLEANRSFTSVAGLPVSGAGIGKAFHLGVEGQGVGDPLDCICFTNIENKDDDGPVRYGTMVSIKAPSAKERLLGLKEGSKLGFWRNLVGQGEKWQVLKASANQISNAAGGSSGGTAAHLSGISRGCEDLSSRGMYMRLGDAILLQTYKSDHLLSLYEALGGPEARLVYRDRAGLGCEAWQVEQFGSVGLPAWYHSRPYLSGQYLVLPSSMKTPTLDVQARAFPTAALMMQQERNSARTGPLSYSVSSSSMHGAPPPALNTMPPHTQQFLLMRDLLQVLAGVEGQYIRVAAAPTPSTLSGLGAESTAADQGTDSAAQRRRSEAAVVSAVRSSLTGAPTTTLPKVAELHFLIDLDTADRSVANQVSQLLPICESAVHIREFIKVHSRYEYGLVSHALCAALKKILREFDILIAQLEVTFTSSQLSLQKMVYLLQPSKITLALLEKLCVRLRDVVGGSMVDHLHTMMLEQGDAKARELHHHLLVKAAEPFLDTLSTWIFRGVLADQYGEFMVQEDRSHSKETLQEDFNARYWDNRFTLCETHIPTILRAYALKALTAGKYLSVVLDCAGEVGPISTVNSIEDADSEHRRLARLRNQAGVYPSTPTPASAPAIVLPAVRKLELSLEVADSTLAQAVQEAYVLSSRALLKILDARGLRSHMISLRRFFLLEHGDFFTQFMDTAEEELRREVKDVALGRIQGLLQMAVQTSTVASDPHREQLTCSLASHNLIQHLQLIQSAGGGSAESYASLSSQGLKGVEAFTLDYKVGWPNSIVLSRRAITKYQLLSRLLYFSKHVERRVLASWMGHQSTKELDVRGSLGPAYCLRHRMLHFLQNFVYYVTLEVIGPRGHELEEWLDKAEDLDEVMELHEKFLDTCLKECLLASQDLLRILTKIMTTCLLFADQMQRFSGEHENKHTHSSSTAAGGVSRGDSDRGGREGDSKGTGKGGVKNGTAALRQRRQARLQENAELIQRESSQDSFVRSLDKFSEVFDTQLKEFLDKLWTNNYRHHVQLSNLCVRLDYNGFYSSQFAENF